MQRRHRNSDALQDSRIFFLQKYHVKSYDQSFPMMYIKGGSNLVEVSQNEDFPQKTAFETAFWGDTNLDQVTLEGAGTPHFQSLDIFHMFPEKFWA